MEITLSGCILLFLFLIFVCGDIFYCRRAMSIFHAFPFWLRWLPGSGFLAFLLNESKKRKELR